MDKPNLLAVIVDLIIVCRFFSNKCLLFFLSKCPSELSITYWAYALLFRVINFYICASRLAWSKMFINEPQIPINFYFWISINKPPSGVGLAREAWFSNMQKITCTTFNELSLMMARLWLNSAHFFKTLLITKGGSKKWILEPPWSMLVNG